MKRYVHTIDVVFALVLFCVFAMSLLLVLLTGAQAYRGVRDSMEEQYAERTCIRYIAAKVRHYDEAGAVSVGELNDLPALCLAESMDGGEYVTYLYYYEGYICELFTDPMLGLTAGDGTRILEAGNLTFTQPMESLLCVTCTDTDGDAARILLSLRSGGRTVS